MEMQYRIANLSNDDSGPGFSGYAATWWAVDSYVTAMKPGAFRKTLAERGGSLPVLWQHDPYCPIGVPRELREDKTGLRFDIEIVEGTRQGSECMALLRAGVPMGMSFGFQTIKDRSAEDDDPLDFSQMPAMKPQDVRVITETKLFEISPVTFPANEAATISSVRAGMSLTDEQREALETMLATWRTAAPAPGEEPTPRTDVPGLPWSVSVVLANEHGLPRWLYE